MKVYTVLSIMLFFPVVGSAEDDQPGTTHTPICECSCQATNDVFKKVDVSILGACGGANGSNCEFRDGGETILGKLENCHTVYIPVKGAAFKTSSNASKGLGESEVVVPDNNE